MIKNKFVLRTTALFLIFNLLVPTVALSLTSGPSQPEFSSFEPVATTNMVDEFTGDFTYNLPLLEVPGPHGSGYPLSLSYHSGVTSEEEASWVGYGWTLNPGAINRGTRGLPDDYKGKDVIFHNKTPSNWTATIGGGVGVELFGFDKTSANASLRYNNYRGFGYNAGFGISLGKGLVSMGYNVSDGSGSYSLNVNPYALLTWKFGLRRRGVIVNQDRYLDNGYYRRFKEKHKSGSNINLVGSTYGLFSYTETTKPNIVQSFNGKSFNLTIGLQGNAFFIPVGGTGNVFGSYAVQTNTEIESVPSYGYLYSGEAGELVNSNTLMDYHVEQERDFNPRNNYLGIPFNDADNFIVTGEGIGGGFRMYHKTAGHFGPRKTNSHTDIFNIGGEIGVGWTFGPGADLGMGSSDLIVQDWNKSISSFEKISDSKDEPVFFRFNNDMGGEWGNMQDDNPIQASFDANKLPVVSAAKTQYNLGEERSGRSSYIDYHTNQQMRINGSEAYNKIAEINNLANRTNTTRDELIGEFTVVNENGIQYNYGLPVYARNEKNLNYSAKGLIPDHNFIAYTETPNTEVKTGQEKNSEYATTYLLTEILTPDYIDRLEDTNLFGEPGASPDDLGGYTRFNYQKSSKGGTDEWYYWRSPFKGLLYNRNSHSDPLDDVAGYSCGEKQIYFLKSVETKSHVALFNLADRLDSREAIKDNFNNSPGYGPRQMERLESIELYSINDFQRNANGDIKRDANGTPELSGTPKPIKKVYFEYDYTLTDGTPNSSQGGKLKLKRVYFEYNKVGKTRISPYEFQYSYPDYTLYPTKYKSGTDDVTADFKDLSLADQNPVYSYFLPDAWGNYQKNGVSQFDNDRTWLDQSLLSKGNKNGFDPAAWQLKVIKLPSGGEIHVQYEQDDYSYVQDQKAHVMAVMSSSPTDNSFTLNLNSIGVSANSADIDEINKMIIERYVTGGKKIYFKVRYRLIGNSPFTSNPLGECNAEYISGYVSVLSTSMNKAANTITVNVDPSGRLPRDVCYDFVKSQRLGKIVPVQSCDPSIGMRSPDSPGAIISQLGSMLGSIVSGSSDLCLRIDFDHSYLRIPTSLPKSGGGLRVKRLLMFDRGIDSYPVLYGNEYVYKTRSTDGTRIISSGVATNEPSGSREENILVDFVARKNQSTWSKIVAGEDKDQSEGPLGESVLPGPSVGYSKVIVRSIHSGKSNPGFSVSEFFTAKDYPIKLGNPDLPESMTTIARLDDVPEVVPTPYYNKIKNKTRATQGFSFIVNNMHGKPKSSTAYSGSYSNLLDPVSTSRVSSIAYEYYLPGEKIPVMKSIFGGVTMKNPGREVDITFSQRQVIEKSNDVNIEADAEMSVIPLAFIVLVIPYPSAIPSFSYIDGELSTHSTTKVVRYPAILKTTSVYQDGISHTQENLAFDEYTGQPVAVRSMDEFKGGYLEQNIPASWIYPNFTSKAIAQGKVLRPDALISQQFNFSATSLTQGTLSFTNGGCAVLGQLTTGDVVQLNSQYLYSVDKIDFNKDQVNLIKADNLSGTPTAISTVKIVSSGRTNRLSEKAGSITFHNPAKTQLSPANYQVTEADRYVTSGASAEDGSAFVRDLNSAFTAYGNAATVPVLAGPYNHMNILQYVDQLNTTCGVDLTDATIRNVKLIFIVESGNLKIRLGTLEVDCGGGNWVIVNNN